MRTTFLHASPAYELSARLDSTPYGYHLQLLSFVPTARTDAEVPGRRLSSASAHRVR